MIHLMKRSGLFGRNVFMPTPVLFALCVIGGYLIGSIPFALVIARLFFKTDLRQHGSGNPGGTNAGRVLGKKVGIAVTVLDALKVVLAVWIGTFVSPSCALVCGVACCFGHCFPIFAHFKGGKAVASMFGFLLAISIFVFGNALYFFCPLIMWFVMLYLYKWVSVSSIAAALASSLQIISMNWSLDLADILMIVSSILLTVLVIWRHKANIIKVRDGKESKVTWI